MAFELPTLPYSKAALGAKGMCQETLDLHHGKHHQAYVTALNGFVEKDPALQGKSLDEIVKSTAAAGGPVFNNAGQHWNHIMFWQSHQPERRRHPGEAGSQDQRATSAASPKFKDAFKAAGVSQFGSGWAWLVLAPDGKLKVTKTPNGSNPLATGEGKVLLAAATCGSTATTWTSATAARTTCRTCWITWRTTNTPKRSFNRADDPGRGARAASGPLSGGQGGAPRPA